MKRIFFILLGIIVLVVGFFLYTTRKSKAETMMLSIADNKPDSLNLFLPKEDNESRTKYTKVENALSLILLGNDMIYGYIGNNIASGKPYNYTEIRDIIKQESAKHSPEKFVVIIKPEETATYKNTVDILDEMTINQIKRYAIVKLSDSEQDFLQKFEQAAKN